MPDASQSSMESLAALLKGHATLVVDKERIVPSITYDFDYRVLIVCLAFDMHASIGKTSIRQINSARLKLIQFIAQRPWLLEVVREWGETRRDAHMSMLAEQRLRRGYVSDSHFDFVIEYLVARGILRRTSTHLLEGPHYATAQRLSSVTGNAEFAGDTVPKSKCRVRLTNKKWRSALALHHFVANGLRSGFLSCRRLAALPLFLLCGDLLRDGLFDLGRVDAVAFRGFQQRIVLPLAAALVGRIEQTDLQQNAAKSGFVVAGKALGQQRFKRCAALVAFDLVPLGQGLHLAIGQMGEDILRHL